MVKMMVVRDGMKGVLVEMLALLLMVMIEIIIEGEAGGLALGCVEGSGFGVLWWWAFRVRRGRRR